MASTFVGGSFETLALIDIKPEYSRVNFQTKIIKYMKSSCYDNRKVSTQDEPFGVPKMIHIQYFYILGK